ncbi:purine-nucleoside phosphorylase [Paraoerskovia marina]|uniref:purine-nucleoside phosphorylase n=1 Tax=Paraoerskovia marina TaxID=545619 RepID=UPI000492E56A|nr:purine-nucleoside phosphorylase [Paraoerskovia marina]
MSTAHISADAGDFAPDVLMPGDPYRARNMAAQLLDDARVVSDVRGIQAYTGTHAGRPLSVMASGMGSPSATIYATELVREFGVRRIVRVGTAGGITSRVGLRDVVVATAAHTDSAMTASRIPGVHFSHTPSFAMAARAVAADTAAARDGRVHAGAVFTSDHFYLDRPDLNTALAAHGTLAIEMESAALYAVAAAEDAEALTVVTVSDHLLTREELTSDDRARSFQDALEVALAALAD